MALSDVYGLPLNIRNVTGINIMHNQRLETKEEKKSEEAA
jgi:hypothetical protein